MVDHVFYNAILMTWGVYGNHLNIVYTSRQRLIMGKKLIPDEIREKVSVIVEKFNQQELKTTDVRYIVKFQGRFLYLDRIAYGQKEPVSRMADFSNAY